MQASAEIIIDRPVETVWAYIADVRTMDKWVAGVSNMRQTSPGEMGVGALCESEYSHAGKNFVIKYEITAFDPPHKIQMQATEGPFAFRGTTTIDEAGPGRAKLVNTIAAGSDGGCTTAIFVLLYPLVKSMMRKHLMKELQVLKAELEK